MMVARLLTGAVSFALMLCTQDQGARPGRPLIDLRLASDTVESGFLPMRAPSDTIFYVDRAHVVSDSDIQSASVVLKKDGFLLIQARLTPSAMSRYDTVVKQHVGERLAIILDGQFLGAPIIVGPPPPNTQPSSDPYVDISVQLADSTARRIKALIIARWPAHSH